MMRIRNIFNRLEFPCPGCGSENAAPGGRSFCPECLKKLQLYSPDGIFCPGCGGRMDGALAVCSQCLAEPERLWHSAVAVFPYRSFGRRIIRELKFAGRPELVRPLAVLAAEAIRARGQLPDVLVPVPLHWSRFLVRGYNQADLLAEFIGRELNVPVVKVLKRRRSRIKQAKLGRRERHSAGGIFHCAAPEKLCGKQVMLIDDVMTTGATLSAAAAALQNVPRHELSVAVIARTPAYGALPELT